jgi:hypothetical protein
MGRNQYDLEPELSIAGMATHEAKATLKKAGRMGEPMKAALRKLNQGLRPGGCGWVGWYNISVALARRGFIDGSNHITKSGRAYLRALDLLDGA